MSGGRGLRSAAGTAALAAGCVALLIAEVQRGPPLDVVVLQPIAPPLTRIASLGDHPLSGPTPPPRPGPGGPQGGPPIAPPHPGGPGGPPPAGGPAEGGGAAPLGHVLRVAVEADAAAMAQVLGPERVEAAVRNREALSALVGESATWTQLVAALEARAAAPAPAGAPP